MTAALDRSAISRRGILAGIGGMTFCAAFGPEGLRIVSPASATAGPAQISPWVRIAPDGRITIFTITEMGQGSGTSIPLIVAEEMDADWDKVSLEWAPSKPETYGWPDRGGNRVMTITGSRAVMMYWNDLRMIGAQIRKVLIAKAAERWGVDAATLKTEPSVVVDPASGRRLSYGEIAASGTIPAALPAVDKSELKARKDFRLVGRPVPRRDLPAKVAGAAQYALDVKLPGMLYATALHSPVNGNAPQSWNDAEIKAMPGVVATVKLAGGVGIVAESFPQAVNAQRALKVVWSKGKTDSFNSAERLQSYASIASDSSAPAHVVDRKGDVAAAFDRAAKTYKTAFHSDYAYHAQMEPLNAVARFNEAGDRVEVWDGSQDLGRGRDLIAKALGFKPEQIDVHQCYLGGGYGRRSLADYALEAVLLARAVKRPVKLVWTREEDVAHGMFRPMTYQSVEAALDASGQLVGWRHGVVGDDGGAGLVSTGMRISPYYAVPNQSIEARNVDEGIRVKHWRAVAHNANLFAIEATIDEIAADQRLDPIEFRLKRMPITPKARRCVETVAAMANWGAKRPDGRALGFSMSERAGSLGACIVEASLERQSGVIRVHKVWFAADGGIVVQPLAAKTNVESGIVWGLSSALHERVTIRNGAVEQTNFGDYSVMRMSDMPEEMSVAFVDSDGPPTGLGEISTPSIAPAVANAFHKLTGKRLYHMPFTPERVLAALKV